MTVLEPAFRSNAMPVELVILPPFIITEPVTLSRLTPLAPLLVDVIEANVAPDPKEVLVISRAVRAVIALAVPPILMVPPALAIKPMPLPAFGMLRLLRLRSASFSRAAVNLFRF